MNSAEEVFKIIFPFQASPAVVVVAFALIVCLAFLLALGRRLQPALLLERIGIPIALLVGSVALLIGPYGPLPVFPETITDIWVQFPTPLLTLVFATLMLGRPIPNSQGLFKPVASQTLLGLLLGFGQYLFGGIAVLFLLSPFFDVNPLMGCLIEVGFEGGHGAAAIMGESFEKLGFSDGLDLGLAMATVGLLSSTLIGSGLVVLGRVKGWIAIPEDMSSEESLVESQNQEPSSAIKSLLINFLFIGLAVLLGFGLLLALRSLSPIFGVIYKDVIDTFPVFPLALLGSLIVRYLLEKTDKTKYISQLFQREIGILSTDLLITVAMASLNLPILRNAWLPITVLSVTGLVWNLFGMLFFARIALKEEWFERSITEFGNATGVAASGLLLLRLADPLNRTRTLPIFSIKQLFLQPFLSGGLITVIAPIVIGKIGLIGWTEVCGFLTALFIFLAIYLQMDSLD